jgi:hypothetical protein
MLEEGEGNIEHRTLNLEHSLHIAPSLVHVTITPTNAHFLSNQSSKHQIPRADGEIDNAARRN